MVATTRTIVVSLAGFLLLSGCSSGLSFYRMGEDRAARGPVASNDASSRHRPPARADGSTDPFFVDHSAEAEPHHCFTREKHLRVMPPARYSKSEIPQVSVWWSNDNGFLWREAGRFESTGDAFEFKADGEGEYAFRFVGPSDPPPQKVLASPELVFHVDASPPDLQLIVEPEKTEYRPGDRITLSWHARDPSLEDFPVRIGLLPDFAAESPEFVELQRGLVPEGSISYEIPPDAAEQRLLFRAEALDRCGNIGLAYSFAIPILPECTDDPEKFLAAEAAEAIEDSQDQTASLEASPDESLETRRPHRRRIAAWARAASDRARQVIADIYAKASRTTSPAARAETARVSGIHAAISPPPRQAQGSRFAASFKSWKRDAFRRAEALMQSTIERAIAFAERTRAQAVAGAAQADPEASPPADLSWPLLHRGPEFATHADGGDTLTDDEQAIDVPRPVPFASAVARLAETSAKLIWRGPAPSEYPSGVATSRAGEGLNPAESSRSVAGNAPKGRQVGRGSGGLANRFGTALRGAFARFDPTRGNHLLIPMPATVEPEQSRARFVTAHPWRMLGELWGSPIPAVWSLPETQRAVSWHPEVKGRFLADHPTLRNVAEPATKTRFLAGGDEIKAADAP